MGVSGWYLSKREVRTEWQGVEGCAQFCKFVINNLKRPNSIDARLQHVLYLWALFLCSGQRLWGKYQQTTEQKWTTRDCPANSWIIWQFRQISRACRGSCSLVRGDPRWRPVSSKKFARKFEGGGIFRFVGAAPDNSPLSFPGKALGRVPPPPAYMSTTHEAPGEVGSYDETPPWRIPRWDKREPIDSALVGQCLHHWGSAKNRPICVPSFECFVCRYKFYVVADMQWGVRDENGNFNGVIGDLQYKVEHDDTFARKAVILVLAMKLYTSTTAFGACTGVKPQRCLFPKCQSREAARENPLVVPEIGTYILPQLFPCPLVPQTQSFVQSGGQV